MNDLENMLNQKIKYLYSMLAKYAALNEKTKYKYQYRQNAINAEIEVLEQLKYKQLNDDWDDCYQEDLRESKK